MTEEAPITESGGVPLITAKHWIVGEPITAEFIVVESSIRQTKKGKSYVDMTLRAEDGTEFRGCKIWDSSFQPEGVILAKGIVDEFNQSKQIKVISWEPSDTPRDNFQPKAPWEIDPKKLVEKWIELTGEIKDEPLQSFTKQFVAHWGMTGYPMGEPYQKRLLPHPGAVRNHHAYRYGLMEHMIEVMTHAKQMAEVHDLNARERDLLLAGCAMHDIGKLEEIEVKDGLYIRSEISKAYGWSSNSHLFIGSQMLAVYCMANNNPLHREDFLVLQNIILSHHGYGDWSPVRPAYLVSAVAHYADNASATINRMKLGIEAAPGDEVVRDAVGHSYLRVRDR